jgi:hypothetical protein
MKSLLGGRKNLDIFYFVINEKPHETSGLSNPT